MAFTPKYVTEYVKHAKTCFPATKAFDALDFASAPPAKIKHLHEAAGLEMAFITAEKFHELFRDKSRWGESAVGAYMADGIAKAYHRAGLVGGLREGRALFDRACADMDAKAKTADAMRAPGGF